MKLFAREEKVGLLVIVAIISLTYLTFRAGNLSWGRKQGTVLYANFSNVRGLDKGAQVRVAGIEAGRVEEVALVDGVPRLTLLILSKITVRQDSVASIESQGFMGEKYVELSPGAPNTPPLKSGSFIPVSEKNRGLEYLTQQASGLAQDLKKITEAISETIATPEGKLAMKQSLANLQLITNQIKDLLQQNTQQINTIMSNFQQLSANLNQVVEGNEDRVSQIIHNVQILTESLRQKGPGLLDQFQSTAKELDEMISENRGALHEGVLNANQLVLKLQKTSDNLNNLLATVNKGEGTIGKLVKDDTLYRDAQGAMGGLNNILGKADAFRLYLGYRTEYVPRFDKSKSYVSLKLQPASDKYYLLDVVDDFRGITTTKETTLYTDSNGPMVTREEVTEDRFKFSIQVARRFQDITLRGGLIESTGGVGLDYFFLKDAVQMHFSAWDFTDQTPHLKLGVDYHFGKYFFLNTGLDHMIDDDRRSYFLGGGFCFEDKDLKYLLGKIPIPGL